MFVCAHFFPHIGLHNLNTIEAITNSVSHGNILYLLLVWDKKMVHTQFNWCWYHIPTFAPYNVEGTFFPLILANGNTTQSAKTAALVLLSLTPNGQSVFRAIAEYQLSHPDEEGNRYILMHLFFNLMHWNSQAPIILQACHSMAYTPYAESASWRVTRLRWTRTWRSSKITSSSRQEGTLMGRTVCTSLLLLKHSKNFYLR